MLTTKRKKSIHGLLVVERLESRVLFSADVGTELGLSADADDVDHIVELLPPDGDESPYSPLNSLRTAIPVTQNTLVVIDVDVPDIHTIVDELQGAPGVTVVIADGTENPLSLIASSLASVDSVDQLHIISHGDGSGIRLGGERITAEELTQSGGLVSSWSDQLTADADILIYGCNLAASDEGVEFMQLLAELSGADIAASDNATGHHQLNADWQLEAVHGDVNAESLFHGESLNDWKHSLSEITVSTTIDQVDGDTSSVANLIASPGADQEVSLREAIIATNNTPGHDRIYLPADTYKLSLTGPDGENAALNGDLDITDDLTIQGQDQTSTTIDAADVIRHFEIHGVSFEATDLTLTRGSANDSAGTLRQSTGDTALSRVTVENSNSGNYGGAIRIDGGTLTVVDSVFENNKTGQGGGALALRGAAQATIVETNFIRNNSNNDGGAIDNAARLTIIDSEFERNTTYDDGSAVTSTGTVEITDSDFTNNTTSTGGGTVTNRGTMTVSGAYFESNQVGSSGGGIVNNGQMLLEDSTFYDNISNGLSATNGGGAFAASLGSSSTLNNITFSENRAANFGGAIFDIDGDITVTNATFYKNFAEAQGGAISLRNGSIDVSNSIFSENSTLTRLINHLDGNYSTGFNLFDNNPVTGSALSDIVNGNPNLGVLQDNGGSVPTIALLQKSDAIDSGKGVAAPDATGTLSNEFVDIGAYEYRAGLDVSKIYWTDQKSNAIYRANEDGSAAHEMWAVQKIADTTYVPQDIEIDTSDGSIYWTETYPGYGNILHADKDGQNKTVVTNNSMDGNLLEPYGLAIDTVNRELYVLSDSNSNNNNGDVNQNNAILKYDITAAGLSFDSVIFQSSPQSNFLADIEYYQHSITGDSWLLWSDVGDANNANPFIWNVNISGTLDGTGLALDAGSIPQSVAFNPITSEVFAADNTSGLWRVGVAPDGSFPAVGDVYDPTAVNSSGVAVDANTGTVWYSMDPLQSESGSIWAADGAFQNQNLSLAGVSPHALALSSVSTVDIALSVDTNTGIVVDEGAVQSIAVAALEARDDDTPPANIVYSVTTVPAHGHLARVGATATPINSFTQQDILNNAIVYVHNDSENFNDEFEFSVTDGLYVVNNKRFVIDVTPVAEAPVALPATISVTEGGTVSQLNAGGASGLDLSSLVTDTDTFDPVTYALKTQASVGTVTVGAAGEFSYVHDDSEVFADQFEYEVTDSTGLKSSAFIDLSITPVNDEAPVANNDLLTVAEGGVTSTTSSGTSSLLSNDSDQDFPNDTMSAVALTGVGNEPTNGTVTIATDGSFTYTHNGNDAVTDSFRYQVQDAIGRTSTAQVTINIQAVNDNVPAVPDDTLRLNEGDTTGTFVTGRTNLLEDLIDTDANDSATVAVIVAPANGNLVVNADNSFWYTHDGSEVFTDEFIYEVIDAVGNKDTVTVKINIIPVNENLPFVEDGAISVLEGGTATSLISGSTSLLDSVVDVDAGDSVTVKEIAADVSNGVVSVLPDGTFSYQHNGSETTSDHFSYVIEDSAGNTHVANVEIEIQPVNDNAPYVADDILTLAEGGTTTVFDSGRVSLLQGVVDLDLQDSASVSLLTMPVNGQLSVNPDNTFEYTHFGTETTSDQFTYSVIDGGANTHRVSVQINIIPVNDVTPFVPNDVITVLEGGTALGFDSGRISLLDNLVDGDLQDSAFVSVITQPVNGQLIVNSDMTFSYNHDGTETTADTFTYEVSDDAGNVHPVSIDVNITLVNENPPFVPDDVILVDEGSSSSTFTSGRTNLLQGLVDDDLQDTAAVAVTVLPVNGVLTVNQDNTFEYVHDGSETVVDSFEYTVTDAVGNSHSVLVQIDINPVNENPPFVPDDVILVDEGNSSSAFTSGRTNLLQGLVDDDPQDAAAVAVTVLPVNGTLTVNQDNTFEYTHDGSETIVDSFEYSVTDGAGNTHLVAIQIGIDPINDNAPFVPDDKIILNEGSASDTFTSGRTNLLQGLVDDDLQDTAAVALLVGPLHGSLTINPDFTFSYVHDGTETVLDSFQYEVADSAGNTHLVNIQIDIAPVNENAPFVPDDTLQLNEGATITSFVSGRTNLIDGLVDEDLQDIAAVTIAVEPVNGVLVVNSDLSFAYIHNGTETTTDSFVYDVTDDANNVHPVTINIDITPVNENQPFVPNDSLTIAEGGVTDRFVSGRINLLEDLADNDLQDSAVVANVVQPVNGVLVVNPDATFTYSHSGSETTTDSFSYDVVDAAGNTHNVVIAIDIVAANDNSPFLEDGYIQVTEGGQASILNNGRTNLLDGVVDADVGDSVSIMQVFPPAFGTLNVLPNGSFTYQHDGSETSSDQFSYVIEDSGNNSHTVSVFIDIAPVNDNMPYVPDDQLVLSEGGAADSFQSGRTSLLQGLVDADQTDTAAVSIVSFPVNGILTVNPDSTFSYLHDGSETTVDSFTYDVIDSADNAHRATIDINITPVNENTPTVPDDQINVAEGGQAISLLSGRNNLLSDVVDEDSNDTFSVQLVNPPSAGVLSVLPDGTFSYVHDDSEVLVDQFSYIVVDAAGNTGTATVQVAITPVNDNPPFVPDDTIQITESGMSSSFTSGRSNLLDGLQDADLADSATVQLVTSPENGLVSIKPDHTFEYFHNGSETISDQFSYNVSDEAGNSHLVNIAIAITPVNDNLPQIPPVSLTVDEGGSVNLTDDGYTSLLQNVSDIDVGDSFQLVNVSQLVNGTLVWQPDGTFSYVHDGSENLADEFIVQISDGSNISAAPVTINVIPVNDAPEGTNTQLTILEDNAHSFSLEDFGFTDTAENHGFDSILLSQLPQYGTLALAKIPVTADQQISAIDIDNGALVYQPIDHLSGVTDSVSFKVVDDGGVLNGGADTDPIAKTVAIEIQPVNDGPLLSREIADIVIPENVQSSIPLAGVNASDVEDENVTTQLTLSSGDSLPEWLSYNPSTQTLIANPTSSEIGLHQLELIAVDSEGAVSQPLRFGLIIEDVNDAPVDIQPSFGSLAENSANASIAELVVTDPDALDSSSITVDDPRFEVLDGILKLRDGESIDYETEPQIQLQLTATDSGSNQIVTGFTLDVLNVNEAPVTTQVPGTATPDSSNQITLPADLFVDPDGEQLTVTATLADGSELPGWLQFDPSSYTFTIIDEFLQKPIPPIKLVASDAGGQSTSAELIVIIEPVRAAALDVAVVSTDFAPAESVVIDEEISTAAELATGSQAAIASEVFTKQEEQPAVKIDNTVPQSESVIQVEEENTRRNEPARELLDNLHVEQHAKVSKAVTIQSNTLSINPTGVNDDNQYSLNELFTLSDSSAFMRQSQMQSAMELVEKQQELQEVIVNTTVTSGASLTLGYIVWVLRSGVVFSSMMAGLPAWRNVDPLPILSTLDSAANDDSESESLETLVENSVSPKASKS